MEIIEPYRQRANERLLNEFSDPEKDKFLSFLRHSLEVLNEDLGPNPILNKIIEDSKK